MKRYCQTLELYNDKELIKAYVAEHAHVWDEVKAGIREVGIIDMQIYIEITLLFRHLLRLVAISISNSVKIYSSLGIAL